MLVWTLPDRRSHWLHATSEADQNWPGDTYTGVALPDWSAVNLRAQQESKSLDQVRAKAEETTAIPGLWLDLDFLDDAHKKPGLPTKEEADAFIRNLTHTPTIVVHSGHGYQFWWLFAGGAWYFQNDDERLQAQALVQTWQNECRDRLGKAIDSTHDLARVMRLPGTSNHKSDPIVPVEVLEADGVRLVKRLWLQSLNGKTPARKSTPKASTARAGEGLALKADAPMDANKLELLYEAIPEARKSMEHKRRFDDQSASGYDMSLASYAAQAGWSDQEIANLIIFHRRKHKEDLQLGHTLYYEQTIEKARQLQPIATEEIEGEDPRPKLKEKLKVGIERLLLIYDPEDDTEPVVRLLTDNGRRMAMKMEQLTSNTKFRNTVAKQLKIWPPAMKGEAWDSVVSGMLTIMEDVTPGHPDYPGTTGEREQTQGWVDGYLDDADFAEDAVHAATAKVPYSHNGVLYLPLEGLRKWMSGLGADTLSSKALGVRLRNIGWERSQVTAGKSVRQMWRKAYHDLRE